MARLRFSLATKCQILFGSAVVVILIAALSVPWFRMQKLVEESQQEIARRLADAWLDNVIQFGGMLYGTTDAQDAAQNLTMRLIDAQQLDSAADADAFLRDTLQQSGTWSAMSDGFQARRDTSGRWLYRYARVIRQQDLAATREGLRATSPAQAANPVRGVLLIDLRADWADAQIRVNRIYLAVAGLLAGALAIAVFWFILTRIVLSPVRVLRDTAEQVAQGDLNIRSDINTGDEFEQLSEMFNTMLGNLKASQDKLRDLNKQLDLKLGELAQSNLSLFEANRIKGDFLANVSHELRTPLNSIIGFAEVLAEGFADGPDPSADKRRRYIDHILTSSHSLLAMITELLDLAKIEAGRIDLHISRMSVADVCEGLLALIRPQADRKQIDLSLSIARDLPVVQTDPGKFQQILFNLLSNAVKFTPAAGKIELGASHVTSPGTGEVIGVRVWVRDTGPGIPVEQHQQIFEKFRQLDSTHTKEHGGTGLGLAISKELARLLDSRIELDSDIGRGATFSLIIPLTLEEKSQPLMPNLVG
jgi:signal transduction histidine kinase